MWGLGDGHSSVEGGCSWSRDWAGRSQLIRGRVLGWRKVILKNRGAHRGSGVFERPSSPAKAGSAKTRAGPPLLRKALRALVQARLRERQRHIPQQGHCEWRRAQGAANRLKPTLVLKEEWVEQQSWPSPTTRAVQPGEAQMACWEKTKEHVRLGNRGPKETPVKHVAQGKGE